MKLKPTLSFFSFFLCLCAAILPGTGYAAWFVAPNGNDGNDGTIERPFATVQRAEQAVEPGDTVFIRGGLYLVPADQIAGYELDDTYACVTLLGKSGTDENRICYFAYPGEKPKFDLSLVKPAGKRVSAFWVNADWLHIKGLEVVGVQVTITGSIPSRNVFPTAGATIYTNSSKCTTAWVSVFSPVPEVII